MAVPLLGLFASARAHAGALLPLAGLGLLLWRLTPRGGGAAVGAAPAAWPTVSVIIPARNEADNLPRLLTALRLATYPVPLEIIVVDDRSDDATAAVAASYGVRVVTGKERPNGWGGKQWACNQGAAVATGEVLLFTDADTEHRPGGLERAVTALRQSRAGMLTALPYHLNPAAWERLLGPFQLLLVAMTAPYGRPKPGHVFAIGQYLMFERAAYAAIGGHASVAGTMVEDLPLANRALRLGVPYHVYRGAPLYGVRMYATIGDFVRGWRRNFRAGFAYARPLAGLDATLAIAAVSGGFAADPVGLAVMLATALYLGWRQRQLGHFSWLGACLWPLSVVAFCAITVLALSDKVLKRELRWKGRAYDADAGVTAVAQPGS